MNKIRIVTTSWDDGHPCDLRLAETLAARSLSATFYVPLAGEDGKPVLKDESLRSLLTQGFEIGAHTMTHKILTGLTRDELWREVRGSKLELEDRLGTEMRMFCYPRGRYNLKVLDSVRKSGFAGARTTRMLSRTLDFGRFEMPTSLQAFPHPPVNYLKNLGKRRDLLGIRQYLRKYLLCRNWVELGKKRFDEVICDGGIWHLYGHSWELEELGLWSQLEELLDYVSGRRHVIYADNSHALAVALAQSSCLLGAGGP
jgi:peptidoglycan-N-acetylglucosamine deacetylase